MAAESPRVVIIKDPTALPLGVKHHEAVDALAAANKAVILLSHGNKYHFPRGWILPGNVSVLEYDLENNSIIQCVIKLRELLRAHGIDVHSRHLGDADPMPIPLAGSVLVMNLGTELTFINKPEEYIGSKDKLETILPTLENEWDIL